MSGASKHKQAEPIFRIWEFLLSALGLGFFTVALFQVRLFYSKGNYGPFDEHNGSFLAICLVLFIILLATKPWKRQSQAGSLMRWMALAGSGSGFLLILACSVPWLRFHIARFEATSTNFKISSYEIGLRRDFNRLLVDSKLGPIAAQDETFLKLLSEESGSHFLESPRAARAAYASLLEHGYGVDDMLAKQPESPFLLACLVAEADPQPYNRLPWLKQLASPAGAGLRETGIISPEDAKKIIAPFFEHLKRLERPSLEALVFCVFNFPELFSDEQREQVVEVWATSFYDLQELAVDGLIVRQQVRELLLSSGIGPSLGVFIEVEGSAPSEYYYRHTQSCLEQMTLGLVRSCGVSVQQVDLETQAQLKVKIKIRQIPLYQYSKPTYKYESYYEYRHSSGSSTRWRSLGQKVRKERRVIDGHEEKTVFAPAAGFEFTAAGESLKLESNLLYWHSLTYDKEKSNYKEFRSADSWKRMWPLGIKSRYYEFDYLEHPEDGHF